MIMVWLVWLVMLIGFVSGDLRTSFLTRQTPEGLKSSVELITGWRGIKLRAGLASEGLAFEASWAVLVPRLIPLRFEIDGLKGELKVKKGQRIKKGQVIAVKDSALLKRLAEELPALDDQLGQEAQGKIEDLLIRAAVEGVVQEITIEAIEGETVRVRLDVKPLYIAK